MYDHLNYIIDFSDMHSTALLKNCVEWTGKKLAEGFFIAGKTIFLFWNEWIE